MMVLRRSITFRHLAPLVAAAAALFGTASASDSDPADGMLWCRVNVDAVNIRVSPNTSNQPVTTLRSGNYFRAKSVENNWLEIDWPHDVPAWVLKDTIQISSADGRSGAVRTQRARIMSHAMSTAQELAALERGARVAIVAEKGDWLQVQAPPATRAYVNAKFVTVDVDPPAEVVLVPISPRTTRTAAAKPATPPDSKSTEVIVLQQQAAWPRSVPASHETKSPQVLVSTQLSPTLASASKQIETEAQSRRAAAAKKQAEAEAAIAAKKQAEIEAAAILKKQADLEAAATKKKAELELAEAAKKKADEETLARAATERKIAEEKAARLERGIVLKSDRPIILTEADFAGPQLGEFPDSAAPAIVPSPAPSLSLKLNLDTPVQPKEPAAAPKPIGPAVVDVDDSNFEAEIGSFKGAVLVDFAARWCGPCRRTAPIVDALAEEYRGRVKVAKIDIDRAPGLASRFGVSSIPCLIMFHDGKSGNRHVGEPPRDMLQGWMNAQK